MDNIEKILKEKNLPLWSNISSELYSDCTLKKQKYMNSVFDDLIYHQKGCTWNEETLEMAFFIKYCNASAYSRLWVLSNFRLPPPTTVDFHFQKKVNFVEYCLTNVEDIDILLDSYWENNKEILKNDKNSDTFDSYTIEVCLGVDAASLTTHLKVDNIDENELIDENSDDPSQKEIKKTKYSIFKDIVDGISKSSLPDKIKKYIDNSKMDDHPSYFFSFLLQLLDWRLPIIAVHLSQSETGHISLKEVLDIQTLLFKINSHKHFSVKYLAADGESGLNGFHQAIYNKYSAHIMDVLNGHITIEDFIRNVHDICFFIPILDILHGSKTGRSRVMNTPMKLGDGCDLIDANSLEADLGIHNEILHDQSSLGKMKDAYPLHLFTCDNARIELGNGKKSAGFYLFLYSLMLEIYRNPHMKIEFRIILADFVLYELLELLNASDNLPSETGFRKNSRSQNKFIWFNDKIAVIKLVNTMIGVCTCLRKSATGCENLYYFGLERLSSHPVEQFFGQYRNHYLGRYKKNRHLNSPFVQQSQWSSNLMQTPLLISKREIIMVVFILILKAMMEKILC